MAGWACICGTMHRSAKKPYMRHDHEELGHFGVDYTYILLQGQYWWRHVVGGSTICFTMHGM
jgi:hypothetical protein